MPQRDRLLTRFSYGRSREELRQRLLSAGPDDLLIYIIDTTDVARLVVADRGMALGVVFSARNGVLDERILLQGNALDLMKKVARGERNVRLDPSFVFFGAILERMAAPRVVFFLAQTANFCLPLGIKIGNYVSANSAVRTTGASVICVVDFTNRGYGLVEGVVNIISSRYRLPFACSFCGILSLERFRKCGRCRSAFYCSKECQQCHWVAEHKLHCGADQFILVPPNAMGELKESYPHEEEFEERVRAFAL